MPKNKKRAKVQKAGGVVVSRPPTDDEYDTADNISTVSHLSDDVASIAESVDEAEVDEASSQELFEDKLKEYIEGTTQKCTQGRMNCLEFIRSALSKKYMDDFLMDRRVTLSENLWKCIKKGKGDEQALALRCFTLMIIQLGIEIEDIFSEFLPMLLNLLSDNSVALKARSESTICLAIGSFLACDDIEIVKSIMKCLEDVFRSSYRKGDTTPNLNPDTCHFHSNALQAWCLLLSIAPAFVVNDVLASHLTKIPDLLYSKDLDLKITAGETLALLYELARESDEEFEGDDIDRLCELLKNLATDCQKSQARKDRKQQRSSFRDILRAIEEADSPRTLIKFGSEQVLLNSWSRKKQYDIFCHVLGTGVNLHLQFNELLRQIFDLGPVIPVGAVKTKLSKFERNQYKAAAFKARTKARSKHRDKRSVTANCF